MRSLNQSHRTTHTTVGLIPARWHSSRFDGKPLAEIDGVPMIKRVYDQAMLCKNLDTVVILTDDMRIYSYCQGLTMPVEMIVSDKIKTGTDRCAEAIKFLEGRVFVNIQGDEPLINPDAIDSLIENHTGGVSNAYVDIDDDYKLHDKNVVKVAIGTPQLLKTYALHYSRLPISNKQQLGLYAFDRDMLEMFPNLPVGENEKSESVEMLRYLENGLKVRMTKVKDEGLSVDTIEDLRRVEEYIQNV